MSETLLQVAAEFGATGPGIVSHARTDIPPRQAMEELRRQFPASFAPVFDARTAPAAQVAAELAKLETAAWRRARRAQDEQALSDMAARHSRTR